MQIVLKNVDNDFLEFLKGAIKLKPSVELENVSLNDYLMQNTSYISKQEQEEIDKLNIDFNDKVGKKVTANDFL